MTLAAGQPASLAARHSDDEMEVVVRLVVAIAVAAGALSACGGAGPTSPQVARDAATSSPTASATTVGKHVEQGSGKLAMSIEPTSGPVGTVVEIRASFCLDANGQNHAVSFNPDTSNPAPDATVDGIRANLAGETLTARYTITRADARGSGHGRFFVQCATDLADLPFRITK
jgi:hypothetical protein